MCEKGEAPKKLPYNHRFDHDYEPGAYRVCRRCGIEKERHGRAGTGIWDAAIRRIDAGPDAAPPMFPRTQALLDSVAGEDDA